MSAAVGEGGVFEAAARRVTRGGASSASTPTAPLGATVTGSKYRHMYGTEAPKAATFFNLQPSPVATDGPVIACSATHWAIPYSGGGGPVYVSSLSAFGKVEPGCSVLNGHKAAVQDIKFSPFHNNILAAGSLDCTVSIWDVDAATSGEPKSLLSGHRNSVRTVDFHPTIPNLLVTTGMDSTIRLTDISNGGEISCTNTNTATEGDSVANNLAFSYDGCLLAVACRDKCVRVVDPRVSSGSGVAKGGVMETYSSPALGRNSRIAWLANKAGGSAFLTTGSLSNGQRVLALWDARIGSIITTKVVDTSSGQLFTLLDESTGLCFLVGKGDTVVKYYETTFLETVTEGGMACEKAAEFQTSLQPFAGVCALPKQCCDVRNVECARLLKLTQDSVIPLSFFTPRSDALKEYFQDDLFPPARSRELDGNPTVEMFVSGAESSVFAPTLESLQPEGMIPLSQKPVETRRTSTRSDEYRESQARQEAEAAKKEADFQRLQNLANQHANYNPNQSMDGGGTDVAEDEWA